MTDQQVSTTEQQVSPPERVSVMDAAESEFAGAELADLRDYCDRIGLVYSKNHNTDTLRKMMRKAMAPGSDHYGEVSLKELSPEEKRLKAVGLVKLNLRSQAGWTGRRRMITLHRSMAHESTRPQFFAWGRLHCYVPMGIAVPIPYPIWEVLQLTAGTRLIRRRKVDEEGRIYYVDDWVPNVRFMYSDMGDDPATKDLPKNMLDMITQLYKLSDKFKGYSERQLREICLRLSISVKKDWDAVEMMAQIEAKCGVTGAIVDIGAPDLGQAESKQEQAAAG